MANAAEAMMWAAVFAPSADEIAESIVRKEELRRSEEKLAEGNREIKKKVIGWLRSGELNGFLRRPKAIDPERTPIYPHITKEQEADMLESGELKLVISYEKPSEDMNPPTFTAFWADETREEAQHPLYLERKKYFDDLYLQEQRDGGIHYEV